MPGLVRLGHVRQIGPGAGGHIRWPSGWLLAAVVLAAAALSAVLAAGLTTGSGSGGSGNAGGHLAPQPPARPAPGPGARGGAQAPASPQLSAPARGADGTRRPNIVFVLTDDLSNDLVQFMPHVEAMQRSGLTFRNYFVSDSLCCPSRASILTGNFPHDTKVFSNVGRKGGFHIFHARGEERHTFAVALHRAGYRTGMMGKYMNGYMAGPGSDPAVPRTYVPPGWTTWDVAGNGYPEFGYTLNENGWLQHYGHQPYDYLTDVLARKGVDFINRSVSSGHPFFLELSTFAPHRPYVPAPRDRQRFPYLRAPRPPSFNVVPTQAPMWLRWRPPLDRAQVAQIDQAYRLRAESVQSVDDMIGSVERTLAADGVSRDTYIIFSSDNGLHMGQYRLEPGKLTAFTSDIRVPLTVVGPGVPAHRTTTRFAENIDLAPTFAALGGTSIRSDGKSLVRILHGRRPRRWPNAALVEHRGPLRLPGDPDYQGPGSGNPNSYEAMRTSRFLYVEYKDGEREYYNLKTDPFELHNVAGRLTLSRLLALHRSLKAMERCHNRAACRRAMRVTPDGARRR